MFDDLQVFKSKEDEGIRCKSIDTINLKKYGFTKDNLADILVEAFELYSDYDFCFEVRGKYMIVPRENEECEILMTLPEVLDILIEDIVSNAKNNYHRNKARKFAKLKSALVIGEKRNGRAL